jgi:nucleoside-diphosphate-sugar epimerase
VDVANVTQLDDLFEAYPITHIAHLAALQTPDCNAHKDLGLQINLAGTQHILEAARRHGTHSLQRVVYASSIAVYGPRNSYPQPRVPETVQPDPVNVYGIWKLASEHILKLFAQEYGVPAVSLRPGVLFGPGRDLGLTSTPTTAMKAIALGLPYRIPFSSQQDYSYAADVGAAFGHTLLAPFSGYGVFTLPSTTLAMQEVVAVMESAAAKVGMSERFDITFGDEQVPFICDIEYGAIRQAFPHIPHTDFEQAVVKSLNTFRDHAEKRWITPADVSTT